MRRFGRRAPRAAAKLSLEPDRATIQADNLDLSFVTVSIHDGQDLMVPRFKHRWQFSVSNGRASAATVITSR